MQFQTRALSTNASWKDPDEQLPLAVSEHPMRRTNRRRRLVGACAGGVYLGTDIGQGMLAAETSN